MRMALLFLFIVPAVASAQPREAAELFPPNTVAYAELRDPAAIANAIAAIVKGSPFEDGLKLLHDRRDANKDPRLVAGSSGLAWAAIGSSPELLSEARKLRGVAVGFLGLTAKYEPKLAACVLTGESAVASLLARTYLANEATLRRVAVVDGVPVYQSRALPVPSIDPNTGKPLPIVPKPATEGPCEPTYAYVPGLFVVASNLEALTELLTRYRGTARDSLATSADFIEFATRRGAGLNGFVRSVEFVRVCDVARKSKRELIDPAILAHLKLVLNPRAIPVLTLHSAVRPEGVSIAIEADRDAKQASPLLDLLAGSLPAESRRVVPANAAGAIAFGLPAKPKRVAAILAFADALAKAEGEVGMTPSEWLAAVEKSSGQSFGAKYWSDVRALSFVFLPDAELPKRVEPLPLLVLHLEPGASQEEWESAIPSWFSTVDGTGRPVAPSIETIRGVKVRSLAHAGAAVHYARRDAAWVFGLDRKQVAECCAANEPAMPTTDAVAGIARWFGLVRYETLRKPLQRLGTPASPFAVDFGGAFLPPGLIDPYSAGPNGLWSASEFQALLGPLPPVAVRAGIAGPRLSIELRWDFGPAGARDFLVKAIPILEKLGAADATNGPRPFLFDR
jgi:hypothetical protein